MAERIDVFISSTSKDLKRYREAVIAVILKLGYHPIIMEAFTPTADNALQLCYDKVQEAEIFVGIYAHRYGYAPNANVTYRTPDGTQYAGDGETGITHWEYKWALERNLPMLLFVVADTDAEGEPLAWALPYIDEEPNKSRLKAFKDVIMGAHVVGFFHSPDHLAAQVATGLPPLVEKHFGAEKSALNGVPPAQSPLHRDYLRTIFGRHSKLSLSYLLDATPKERVNLLDVYVPLKLGVSFNIEVLNGELVDWWLRDQDAPTQNAENEREQAKPKSLGGFSPSGQAWAAWEQTMRDAWARLKANHEEAQAQKPEKDRKPLADGTYRWNRLESEVAPALMSRLVITGDPGSGKSTLLRHLALCMAGEQLGGEETNGARLSALGFWALPAYTPLFIELRALVRSAFPDPTAPATLEGFLGYVRDELLQPHGIADYLDELRAQLRDGHAMLFLDGLDEVPDAETDERREQIKALVDLLVQQYPQCRICITSRPYAYAGDWQLEGFGQVKLTNLDADRLEELALRLFRVVLGQEGAEQEADAFKSQMKNVPEALRGSPLFFTLMASIWLNKLTQPAETRLPVSKGDIYRECVEMLIRRWTRKDAASEQTLLESIGISERQLRQVIQTLAYQVHTEAGTQDDAEFTGGRVLDVVESLRLRRVDIYGLRDVLAQRAGVIYERAPNRYQFAHRSFQEHLAACHLVADARFPQNVAEHLRQQPALWRNVLELLPEEARRQKQDLWKLVKALLPDKDAPLPTDKNSPLWDAVYHAARLMTSALPADDDLQEVYRPRLQKLLVGLVICGALAPVDRAEMGRILSTLGDTRKGVGVIVRDGVTLPDIDWVDIPAPPNGKFMMGADDQDDNKPREVTLDYNFQMARYPITYKQFQAFIDDPEGFHDARWWQGLAHSTNHNVASGDQYFKYWNHPRENVSWYDAIAFCRWLSWRLGGGYALDKVDTWAVRLPTEFEWEYAARGTDGRGYPYGDEFNAAKGNTRETGIGQTSAVGIFPDGASPFGVLDMSGNVWNWCLTDYNTPAERAATEDLTTDARRVLRGGSWNYNHLLARAAYRVNYAPNNRFNRSGFRLVGAPSTP